MDPVAKQQIVERIKQATNILVTVRANPTVDQLAACIGLTLLLNALDKHATAVFSGQVPSTLEFLQPAKTIESNTDSLRDFIISLDKNKADKLRYKIEDQVVRIFITPYRTSITEKDLVFTQGDFNVEVVIGLGIQDQAHIDAAITAHGRILHDATVISINAGPGNAPNIGQINWQDPNASSLCEMITSVSEAFGTGLIDNQMATAFLTGIVAETGRFRNNKTTPKVMTMAAQLMAAGANQQLIAKELEPPMAPPIPPPPVPPTVSSPMISIPHTDIPLPPPPTPKAPSPPPAASKPAPPKPPTPPSKPSTPPAPPKPKFDLQAKIAKDKPFTIPHGTPAQSEPVENDEIQIDEHGNLKVLQEKPRPKVIPVAPGDEVASPQPSSSPAQALAPSEEANRHSLIDPHGSGPKFGGSLGADSEGKSSWFDPSNPVTEELPGPMSSTIGFLNHSEGAQPPQSPKPAVSPAKAANDSASSKPTEEKTEPKKDAGSVVDSARSAVENAIAKAPPDPDFPKPIQALNAQPVDLGQVAQSVPKDDTPSLSLPANGQSISPPVPSTPSAPTPPKTDMAPPAPPPVPPPLPNGPSLYYPTDSPDGLPNGTTRPPETPTSK